MFRVRTKSLISFCLAAVIIITVLSLVPHNVYVTENTVFKSSDGNWSYRFTDGNSVGVEIVSGEAMVPAYKGAGAEVAVPREIDGYRVVAVGPYAFYENSELESVLLPDTVKLIDSYAFALCTALKDVRLPASLKTINECAFFACESLPQLTLPDALESIEVRAFSGCTRLESINIPDSVTSFGMYALENTAILENNKGTLQIDNCIVRADRSLNGVFEIKDGTVVIGGGAFSGCGGLTGVSIPDSLRSICGSAFCDCVKLKEISIPDSVESIGRFAFDGCSSLTEIKIGIGASAIGEGVARNCPSLLSVTVDPHNDSFTSLDGVLYNADKTVLITYPAAKPDSSFTLPDDVGSINRYAFGNCSELKTIQLNNKLRIIPEHCFENSESLEKAILPDKLETIENSAFYKCRSLESIELHGHLKEIGNLAFSLCSSLKAAELPASLKTVGNEAFSGCSSLKYITIPNADIHFRSGVFKYCTSLEKLEIPERINGINSHMFTGCSSLKELSLGDGVRMIGECAFENCDSLESVIIPGKVFNIEQYAFAGCSSLAELRFERGVSLIKSYAFAYCSSLGSVALPETVTSLGGAAFYGCDLLEEITVPESVGVIGNDAFDECDNLTVNGYEGSFAQSYCEQAGISFVSLGFACPDFEDVKPENWYYDSVRYCVHKGYANGKDDRYFGASDPVERQDYVLMLARLSGVDLSRYESFPDAPEDVAQGRYYTAAVNWALGEGIAGGYNDGRFGTGDPLTREQAVVMLYRLSGSPEVENADETLSDYKDAGLIAEDATDAFAWAVENGFISGLGKNELGVYEPCTRAMITTVLMRSDGAEQQ
jgi:hypothetical protein